MRRALDIGLPVITLALLGLGAYLGLVATPPERAMGDVYRILYVHVPSAWAALVGFTICFGVSVAYLFTSKPTLDAVAESTAEVSLVFTTILLFTGSVWARPTWGVFWTWDPRLTTAAIMWIAFMGYLALRRFVDDPDKRATWSAIAAIVIYVDVPIVYLSVKWWNTLHQMQSSPKTVDPAMVMALRVSAFGFLFALWWFARARYGIARARQALELAGPDDEPVAAAAGSRT